MYLQTAKPTIAFHSLNPLLTFLSFLPLPPPLTFASKQIITPTLCKTITLKQSTG
jgi:hypothetical protein